jgi:hypothetical protein
MSDGGRSSSIVDSGGRSSMTVVLPCQSSEVAEGVEGVHLGSSAKTLDVL